MSSSGTTASVVFQNRSSVWVGAAGDSRVLCLAQIDNQWKVQPLTLDHRPSRKTEKFRCGWPTRRAGQGWRGGGGDGG